MSTLSICNINIIVSCRLRDSGHTRIGRPHKFKRLAQMQHEPIGPSVQWPPSASPPAEAIPDRASGVLRICDGQAQLVGDSLVGHFKWLLGGVGAGRSDWMLETSAR